MARRVACILFLLSILWTTAGCSGVFPHASYRSPILPICFTISPEDITISGESSLVTPIGTFSLGASYRVADVGDNDLVLILRNRSTREEHVYRIREGRNAQIVVDGHLIVEVSRNEVVVDITEAEQVEVRYFCALELGQPVRTGSNARLWPGPDAARGPFVTTLPERGTYYVRSGPTWGRIRRDQDISGWWWEISETREGVVIGWIWEGRIAECNYGLD